MPPARLAGIPTLLVLGAVWLYIGVSWANPELFGYAGFVGALAGPTLGLGGLGILAIHAVLVWRSGERREDRWPKLSRSTLALLWGGLLIGLPASLTYTWFQGAEAFCF